MQSFGWDRKGTARRWGLLLKMFLCLIFFLLLYMKLWNHPDFPFQRHTRQYRCQLWPLLGWGIVLVTDFLWGSGCKQRGLYHWRYHYEIKLFVCWGWCESLVSFVLKVFPKENSTRESSKFTMNSIKQGPGSPRVEWTLKGLWILTRSVSTCFASWGKYLETASASMSSSVEDR